MTLQVASSFSRSKGRWVLIRRGEGTESRLAKRPSAWVKKSYKELHNTCFDRVRSFVINLIPLIVDLPALGKKVIPWPVVSSCSHHHHREFKEWRSFRQILCFCCFCVSFVHHQPGDLLGVNHGNHGRMLCLFVFYCYFNLCPSGSTLWRSHNPDVVFAKLVNRTLSWKLNWLSWKILSCSESCPGADGIPAWEWHFLDLFASGQDTRVAPFNGCLIQAIGNSLGHLTGEFLLLLRKRNQGGFCHPLIVFSTDKSGLSSVKGCHKPISNICYLLSPCSVAVDHDWLIGLHAYDSPTVKFALEIFFRERSK